ncbi:MAG: DEAD/DEAH box helicase [Synechococcales cyanobacterium CRU_2_2]|nr:DEAD/DEAH box helicase [Synechococcales cyanobacterium CRU_2_2]
MGPLKVDNPRPIRAVILAPTRELAAQVAENVSVYSQFLPLKCTVVFGGVNINPQISRLRRGVDILVATPGRLIDHIQRGTVDLSQVEILVLDEADRMLDMGFIHDIRKVLALLPKERQNLLFSATFSQAIKTLAGGFLKSPVTIEVARENTAAESVAQVIYPVDRHRKRELLSFLIGARNWKQVLVFTRTKHGANRLAKQLEEDGLRAAAIHGNKSQGARTRALDGFKEGAVRILVATDIAARGIDIDQLPHVVNFELPNVAEDYIHRIGRTGRAGNEGEAVSLVCVDEHKLMQDIERLIKRRIERVVIPEFEPDPSIAAEPIPNGRNGAGGGGRGGDRSARSGSRHDSTPRPGHRDKPRHEDSKPRPASAAAKPKPKPNGGRKSDSHAGLDNSPKPRIEGREDRYDRQGRSSRRRSSAG